MGWISPTSHYLPDGGWSNPERIYDGDTGQVSVNDSSPDKYVELNIAAISCDKIRVYVGVVLGTCSCDIDVYYSGEWHGLHDGTHTEDQWVEHALGSTETVTKMRLCSNNFSIFWFHEAEFNQVGAIYNTPLTIDTLVQKLGIERSLDTDVLIQRLLSTVFGIDARFGTGTWEAKLHGDIDDTGGENCTKRGFVWGDDDLGDPGNVPPESSGYDSYWTEDGDFGAGAFDHIATGLTPDTTFYFRACAKNGAGWSYGVQKSFATTANNIAFSADVLLQKLISESYVIDTALSKMDSEQYSVDTVLEKLGIGRFLALDALLKRLGVPKGLAIDTIFGTPSMTDLGIDILLKRLGISQELAIDTLLEILRTEPMSLDAVFAVLGIPEELAIDVLLQAMRASQFDTDALFRKLEQTGIDIDTLLRNVVLKQLSADAFFRILLNSGYSIDTFIQKLGLTKEVVIDAVINAILDSKLSIDAFLKGLGISSGMAIDAILGAATLEKYGADVLLKLFGVSEQMSLDVMLSQPGIQKEIITDAVISVILDERISIDAIFSAIEHLAYFAIDVMLILLGSRQLAIDTIITSRILATFMTDVIFLASRQTGLVIDTRIGTGPFTLTSGLLIGAVFEYVRNFIYTDVHIIRSDKEVRITQW